MVIVLGGAVELDAAGEAFAEGAEGGQQVGFERVAVARLDARRGAPGQELRIAFDVGHEREHLFGRVGNETLLTMPGQVSFRPC